MEKNTVSILGCGWLGMPLAETLAKEGFIVKGSSTSPEKISKMKEVGIRPFLLDIGQNDYTISEFLKSEILIIAAPPQEIEHYKQFIRLLEKSEILQVLFISSTSVYPDTNKETDESASIKDTKLARAEELFRQNAAFKTTILRFAGLFGYNRKPGKFFPEGRIIDNPEGCVNFIHRDDCIRVIQEIIRQSAWGETFNACTDSHPTRRKFYTQEMLKEGRKYPLFNENSENSFKIISNEKLKRHLNFSFKYPDLMNYREK